jgi:transcriptional regulator with XRE-family HTH domain
MQIAQYIAKAKSATGTHSDYALAKVLGVTQQNIGKWRKGETTPSEYACLRLHEVSGEPLDVIIAAAQCDRETDDLRKRKWIEYLIERGALSAVLLAVFFGASLGTPSPAVAADAPNSPTNLYYVNSAPCLDRRPFRAVRPQ